MAVARSMTEVRVGSSSVMRIRLIGYPNKAANCVGTSSVEEAAMVWPPQTRNVALELNIRSNAIGFHTKIEGLVHK